jgi:uncharacterized protein YwgA
MNPTERRVVILDLIERLKRNGSWCGETHIQKSVFFLQEMMGVPLDLNTIFYKHGPYSFELADELTSMIADNCLTVEPRAPYGASFWPVPDTIQLYRVIAGHPDQYEARAQFVADRLARKNVAELERLSTALYVLKRTTGTEDDLAREVNRLKPHVSPDEARQAVRAVRQMQTELEEARRRPPALV